MGTDDSWHCRHLLFGCVAFIPSLALAGNGLYPSGFGAVSSTMSGVDLAIAEDISALATNPAGMASVQNQRWDIYSTTYYTLDLGHADRYGNDTRINNRLGEIAGGGYAWRVPDANVVVSLGLFAQGGVGYVYEDINTAFGTRDEVSAIFGIAKLCPGIAWGVGERWRIGVAADVVYGSARQKFFPDTSAYDAEHSEAAFFGIRMDGLRGFGFGGRLGIQYQLSEDLRLGASYALPTKIPLESGTLTVNYEALGQGRVRYQEARLDGLALPQEAGLAVAWRATPQLLLSTEASWFNWKEALSELHLHAEKPDGDAPVETIDSRSALDFKDRVVVGVAAQWQQSERLVLRGGYAYSKSPQPNRTLSPTLPLLTEQDYSLGFGYRIAPQWELTGGAEYQPYRSVGYTNPQLPFGANARERNEVMFVHFMLSRHW